LLGLAFHPDVKTNRQVFLHYTHTPGRKTTISRFKLDENLERIDASSEEVILSLDQPWANHNGGMIEFGPEGPDRMLYISLGDGGSGGDPLNSGQRLDTLLGKILRVDVDHPRKGAGLNYAIPEDNPFVGRDGAKGEIWAYGLRNVWRFSFDRQTGELWAGDVGQNAWEEIDVITKGGNYGWRVREGFHGFNPRQGDKPADMIDPIVEHPRREAQSITGGYVYRGKAIPQLVGAKRASPRHRRRSARSTAGCRASGRTGTASSTRLRWRGMCTRWWRSRWKAGNLESRKTGNEEHATTREFLISCFPNFLLSCHSFSNSNSRTTCPSVPLGNSLINSRTIA
jgi:glucose/arabinose dehydrogenase